MNLKKTLALSLAALAVVGAISGCGSDNKKDAKAPAEKKEITVGITPGYSEKVMEYVAQEAEKQGAEGQYQVLLRLCDSGPGPGRRRHRPELFPAWPVPGRFQ